MTSILTPLALQTLLFTALATAPVGALAQDRSVEEMRSWDDLSLPVHFVLDLETGLVASRAAAARPTLTYAGGRLESPVPLRSLPWSDAGPRRTISRDEGDLVSGVTAEVGRELVFDLYGEAWGYLRVTEITDQAVQLEYCLEPRSEVRELLREPARLSARSNARSSARGVELTWAAVAARSYRIDRRPVAQPESSAERGWTFLARVDGARWLDEETSGTQLVEYRVCDERGGFGARARGVGDLAPDGALLHIQANESVNLLSGRSDDGRSDLVVEFVRASGVQLRPSAGAAARILTASEVAEWDLPEIMEAGIPRQRLFVAAGRVLALRLPEGAYARVRVVSIEGQEVTLERRINLDGSRTFATVPKLTDSRWQAGRGVLLSFEPSPERPASERSGILLEREASDGSWSECTRGARGVLDLVDSSATLELLVRYRARRWLGDSGLSPYSEPVAVLIGDDNGAGAGALLERALVDLGGSDYARRGRARAVLAALGERAWPGLREALRSDNVELAAAARELLMQGAEGTTLEAAHEGGDLVGLLLGVRAEELGAGLAPHPDWISSHASVRARAALCGTGWRAASVERCGLWRRVLAEADPQESVRLAATMAGALQREGLGPDLRQAAPGSAPWQATSPGTQLAPHPSANESLEGASPWALLAALQAWHALAHAALLGTEGVALAHERHDLAQALVAQYERSGEELFLDSALRVTDQPLARLRAALDLLSMQGQAQDADEASRRVVRLEQPDTERLVAELEELKRHPEVPLTIILPAGVYAPLGSARQILLDTGRVHLRAEGAVVMRTGFTLMNGCRVVFEGLHIAPPEGVPLNLVKSVARLEGCTVEAQNIGVMGMDSTLEMIQSEIVPGAGGGDEVVGLRLLGRSLLLASESRIEATGIAVFGVRAILLDACVILSHTRNAIEGNGESELWAVASSIVGAKSAIVRVAGGVLDGVVVLGDAKQPIQAERDLRLCRDHLWSPGDLEEQASWTWLERCALHR
jgi:hypothetical protein